MGRLRPLSDTWLFWDAERLESYPHSDGDSRESADTTTARVEGPPREPLRVRLLEDLLIYVAGIASALIGVGLVLLLGSFLSAYSVLSEVNRASGESIVAYPSLKVDRPELLADAATAAAGKREATAASAPGSTQSGSRLRR